MSSREQFGGEQSGGDTATCPLCPRHCVLAEGARGVCGARWNRGGQVVPLLPDRVCALNVDPVEKKPFYHVAPGAPVLSVACAGCTLRCRHCQNAGISQTPADRVPSQPLPPEALARAMTRHGCRWVAFTYTEPLAWYEYTLAGSRAVRAAGGRTLLVTAGYAEAAYVRRLAPWIDAANVDLKAFSDRFYREVCDGALEPVLRTLQTLHDAGVFLEVTCLVIPGWNDGVAEQSALAAWVVGHLGPETPLHLSRFVPRHRMDDRPATPVDTLLQARDVARQAGLRHVYLGNVEVPGAGDTFCAGCGAAVLRRSGHHLTLRHLDAAGRCLACGNALPGLWDPSR